MFFNVLKKVKNTETLLALMGRQLLKNFFKSFLFLYFFTNKISNKKQIYFFPKKIIIKNVF